MRDLCEIIQSCKDGNEEDVIFILNKFDPLINKYSRLLEYEDTKQELSLTLIKVLQRIRIDKGNFTEDKYIISYINKSIINRYIALSKQLSKVSCYESEADINLIYADNDEDVLEMYDLLKDFIKDLLLKL
ncbi:helix-turn-helix domain-containing protein [Clostridium algidicarnis]|uniref:Helix-turn-helix domain-containing protein n=1 Tax=Clostridium algidicarnis TaxID=37659 RepID=A0ABS6C6K4_9CLOT|nr:helix-turn-helix domain-containing protein [Clostridium algidicarnis]MBU3194966.1 helix-turn-helix domain-containing protein [Clostridium algidicarnis]MBU3207979.1 helix-turn-helix domain-containing protein [Clostridium algidicarnis]MBU3221061.1 helix-turn-helix domain-containing protein [Clostridium algidicarnis]